MISVRFQGKPFNITVTQVYALTSNTEEAEVKQFYEDVQYFLELTPKKDVPFIIGDWKAKVGSQELPGVTGKFDLGVQSEAGQRLTLLPRERTGHSKHPFTATEEMTLHMDITDDQNGNQTDYCLQLNMEKLYTVSKNKTWS